LSRQKVGKKAVLTAMLAYNLPVTAYLMYLRIDEVTAWRN
jgi:hypothetical protein